MGIRYWWLVLILLFIPSNALSLERCKKYINDVRIEHTRYFGLTFPYWYGVAQIAQESACRPDITAFDGGQGLAQFMPKTEQYVESLLGEKLDPYNPTQAVRMQAFYMYTIHSRENWAPKLLFVDYQIYNGGKGTLYKEYIRAGSLDWELMRATCNRKKLQMKWGILDMCDVNYDYSLIIYKNAKQYQGSGVGSSYYRYW